MNLKLKFKLCDWLLLVTTVLITASSIQLEVTGGASRAWVWVHMVIAILFITLICWHIYLHFRRGEWLKKLFGKRNLLRWMSLFGLLVVVSAIIATAHWFVSYAHGGIGGLHGKLGFVFLALVVIHAIKHRKFYC